MQRRLGSKNGAAALVGAASLALAITGATAAGAASASHTLKLTSVQTSQKQFKGNHFVDADKDVSGGKVIGYDVLNGLYHRKSQTYAITIAASLRGGLIEGHGVGNGNTGKFTGTVDGGTGAYKGIRGTITGRSTGKNGDNEKLVLTYHH